MEGEMYMTVYQVITVSHSHFSNSVIPDAYAFDNQLHRLSKNKIPNVKNKKDGYSHSDLKKLAAIDYEE